MRYENLRERREIRLGGISQRELGKAYGLAQGTISKAENGKRPKHASTRNKLMAAYECKTVQELLREIDAGRFDVPDLYRQGVAEKPADITALEGQINDLRHQVDLLANETLKDRMA